MYFKCTLNVFLKEVKIVHINTYYSNGGAGRACQRLNQALVRSGINSTIWVNFSFDNNTSNNFSTGFFRKWVTAAGIILERIVAKFLLKPLKTPFSFPIWGRDISGHPAVKEADIIHLHWVNHSFLRPRDLARLARLDKPIVWTFHDSNAFTGGCHVRYGCDHFHQECGNCPLLKNAHSEDLSHKIWKARERAYSHLPFSVIAPSRWMMESVLASKLLGGRQILQIPNTLDTAIFKPADRTEARNTLGLDQDRFTMLSGFMPSRKDLHKGTSYLLEALEIFIANHPEARDRVQLVVFGNRGTGTETEFPIPATFLGTISDDKKLALCYSAADAFLAPSLEDNLPNTVMESLSCGTPVIAFTTGGIPDMVGHLQNGYLAKYRSAEDLATGIKWIYDHRDNQQIRQNARTTVETRFSEEIIARQHITHYTHLLES
jgi:glycosyltransferase involved in cell wall biosynthesis